MAAPTLVTAQPAGERERVIATRKWTDVAHSDLVTPAILLLAGCAEARAHDAQGGLPDRAATARGSWREWERADRDSRASSSRRESRTPQPSARVASDGGRPCSSYQVRRDQRLSWRFLRGNWGGAGRRGRCGKRPLSGPGHPDRGPVRVQGSPAYQKKPALRGGERKTLEKKAGEISVWGERSKLRPGEGSYPPPARGSGGSGPRLLPSLRGFVLAHRT